MKNLITIINLCVLFGITTILTRFENIPKDTANANGKTKMEASSVGMTKSVNRSATFVAPTQESDETVSNFIRETAHARMMYLEEGRLASQRCTTRPLKNYGLSLLNDQADMMEELQKLAILKNVSLDNTLPPDRSEELKDLSAIHGKDFDKKFMKLMASDQKVEVRKFKEATRFDDPDVQVFATKYLPVVESHFSKITSIKKLN
jgi:predicted outer membrane protein